MNREFYRLNNEEFKKRATNVHGDKYIYDNTIYINKRTKVSIICPIHGVFEQYPMNHLRGQGCPVCGKIRAQERKMDCKNHRKTKEEFQEDLNRIYNGKYEVVGEYVNNKTPIEIYCHNTYKNGSEHGIFITKPNDLICGHGCHRCIKSKLETEVETLLKNENIEYIPQKRFDWLNRQSLDFFLPQYNIAIECQGIQHFKPINFKNESNDICIQRFNAVINNDNKKKNLCEKNNVYLLYYANYKYDFPYDVITDKQELLTKILNKNDQK